MTAMVLFDCKCGDNHWLPYTWSPCCLKRHKNFEAGDGHYIVCAKISDKILEQWKSIRFTHRWHKILCCLELWKHGTLVLKQETYRAVARNICHRMRGAGLLTLCSWNQFLLVFSASPCMVCTFSCPRVCGTDKVLTNLQGRVALVQKRTRTLEICVSTNIYN